MTRFTDPRRQADYEMARANHAKCMSAGNAAFTEYRRGYEGHRHLCPVQSAAYTYWAAGRDNARLDRRRRARMGKRA